MDHGIDVTVELDHDAFAEPAEAANHPAGELGRRRLGGAQHKRTADPDALEATRDDPRLEGLQIDDDVRELGHESVKFTAAPPPGSRLRCDGRLASLTLPARESSPLTPSPFRSPHPLAPSPFWRGGTHGSRTPSPSVSGDVPASGLTPSEMYSLNV